MAKRRRNSAMAPSAPSPKEMIRWSAEGVARTAIENHPRMKKARDMITREVMAATERALKKTTLRPKKGE